MSRKETNYIGCKTTRRKGKALLVAHAQPARSAISFPNDAAVAGFCPTRAPPYFCCVLLYVSPYQIVSHGILLRRICASYLLCRLPFFFFFFSSSYFLTPTSTPVGWFSSGVCARAQSPVRRALCLDRSPSTENHGELLWDSTGAASALLQIPSRGPPPLEMRTIRCWLFVSFAVNIC